MDPSQSISERNFRIESDGVHWSDGRMAWASSWDEAMHLAMDMVDGHDRIQADIYDITVSPTIPIGRVVMRPARVVLDFRGDL